MRQQLERVEAPRLLLVEGEDEARFWRALFKRQRTWDKTDLQVVPVGRDRLVDSIAAVAATPGFDEVRWVGVSQDADVNPRGTFERIRTALRRSGLPVPSRPWEPTGSSPRVVAYVMPDGRSRGDLEDFLWGALGDQPAVPCVEAYLACLQGSGLSLPRQLSKARLHAYLASLDPPDRKLGEAEETGKGLPLQMEVLDGFLGLVD